MRVLIVDDEPLVRTALERILTARSDVERFDSAADAIEAEECLTNNNYDVMLLDISLPARTGLELLDRMRHCQKPAPSVVLVTAYAQHALTAFEKHAVDYILKPFSPERVNQALEFALRRTESERAARLLEVMPHLRAATDQRTSKIAIRSSGRILFIDPREVAVIRAQGNYILLQQDKGSYLLKESISTAADKFQTYGFVRIHRSVLVNASFVEEIRPRSTGEYELRVKGGNQFVVTRTYKNNLKTLAKTWMGSGALLAD
jgi:two-component system, LytTR family, response regulator